MSEIQGHSTIDFSRYDTLSFDCYGTLVDWEQGLLRAFAELLNKPEGALDRDLLLGRYSQIEAKLEAGPYMRYRDVLGNAAARICEELKVEVSSNATLKFAESIRQWEPFPDTVPALQSLASRYRLFILSNVDDDLFAATQKRLGVKFAGVITAEQVSSYKPNENNFCALIARVGSKERLVHVAESLYHDHAPAQRLGIKSIWVSRRANHVGATPKTNAKFDLQVPDLLSLAKLALPMANI